MAEQKKRLVIIDGKSVFYRGYYAMPNLALPDGTPTGGVFGFAVMALEVMKRLKPDYACVAWDKPKTNIRKRLQMYPAYKAGRKPAPPDFYAQIPILHEVLEAFGWPLYELDDYEADDIMAGLAVKAKAKGIETILITSDMDALQLVNDHVQVYLLKKGLSNIDQVHPESFTAKYGIAPDQFIDLKSLKGDSSDNIPGVPGIGEKTALDLLKKYKTLDEVYENIELVSGATKTKLIAGKDMAYLSKELVTLMEDAPIDLDLESMDMKHCKPTEIRKILQRLQFKSLLRQLPEAMQVSPAEALAMTKAAGNFSTEHVHFQTIDTPQKLHSVILDIQSTKDIVVSTYCTGAHGLDPKHLLISPKEELVYALDLTKLDKKDLQAVLGPIYADPKVAKIGFDIKRDIEASFEMGLKLTGVEHDVMVGAFLLNALLRQQSLTDLAENSLGYEGVSLDSLPAEEFIDHAKDIVTAIWGLYKEQVVALAKIPKLKALAHDIEWPVIEVLAAMEHEGVLINTAYMNKMSDELGEMITDLEQQIYGHADSEFNISSPAQLADILFVKLNLPTTGVKKGKTGYSTAADELAKLRGLHPIIDLVSQYREVTKLKSTYIDSLPKLVDKNNRLHTSFSLTTAQTGRLSSSDPNLQNIPVRSELGRKIRKGFIASPGNTLVSADYSQFELRLAAYLSGDKDLMKLFNEGADIHVQTAAQVYGVKPAEVSKEQRRDAKVINFGILYGMSPHGLSVATGMTNEQAKVFIQRYFELRKPLLEYINHLKEKARKEGYVDTLFGRRRPTPDVQSSNFIVRNAAERQAINMPVQGTEADLMKMAMIKIQRQLAEAPFGPDCKQVLQIHDSILVEVPEAKAEAVAELLKNTMETIYELPVKLDVDVHTGKTWGDL